MDAPVTVDFETEAILPRPDYPPRPVGAAVWEPGRKPRYLAWGHPVDNNASKRDAVRYLRTLWRGKRPLLFHNAKFDLDVADTHLGLALPPVDRIWDTTIEAFLFDPNERDFQLKSLAENLLDLPPDEQSELRDWVLANVPEARKRKKDWGAFIARAPGKLVAPYAIGDVVRTRRLHDLFWPDVVAGGMVDAFRREQRLLYVLLDMERRGIPVDAERLGADIGGWERVVERLDDWVRKRLRAPDLELDKNQGFADVLERAGVISSWVMTAPTKRHPGGQRSTALGALEQSMTDVDLLQVLRYRARLANALRTFARPWREMAGRGDGRLHVIWNQVRQASQRDGKKSIGARTGRLSSTPNVMNVPRVPGEVAFSPTAYRKAKKRADDLDLPAPLQLPASARRWATPLPNLRDYVVGGDGAILCDRDYSQQELRILGHFEDGPLQRLYQEEPWLDLHDRARREINALLNAAYARKPVKNTGFGIIYGMGLAKLALSIDEAVEVARELRKAYKDIFPGLKDLEFNLKRRAKLQQPIRTWGGRLNYVEDPIVKDGRMMTFEYKLLNTLIQGSAADNTKQAMLNYDELKRDGELILQVHDQLTVRVPDPRAAPDEMRRLREAMEAVEFDVPMLSEGEWGWTWARLETFDQKGKERWTKLPKAA